MHDKLELQIFVNDRWHDVGVIKLQKGHQEVGYKAPSSFEYNFDFLDTFVTKLYKNNLYAVSLNYPLNFELFQCGAWLPFLLDILPSGAARQFWLKKLNIIDGPAADFELLKYGGFNPPGNLRIKPTQKYQDDHEGFSKQDIIEHSINFTEYAASMGAFIAGASGAQGVAPKFLMIQDKNNKWHADASLCDSKVSKYWLIKFARDQQASDQKILELEYKYHNIAKILGLNVYGDYDYHDGCLFIPRFDRQVVGGKTIRLGMESFTSGLNISKFGAFHNAEDFLHLIDRFSSQPKLDIKEYLLRDFVNICLGNTDNHGRNFAFLKNEEEVRLSPLYDFAPMVLDRSFIPRATKWKHESGHVPNFNYLEDQLCKINFNKQEVKLSFQSCLDKLENINALVEQQNVEIKIKNRILSKYDAFIKALNQWCKKQ